MHRVPYRAGVKVVLEYIAVEQARGLPIKERNTGGGELPPLYYLDNFLSLCGSVERQYGDLLGSGEVEFLQCFLSLDKAAQCLYVRLISRAGPWFRTKKLVYPEIGDLSAPLEALIVSEFAVGAGELSVENLGSLFTKLELSSVFKGFLPEQPAPGKSELLLGIEQLGLEDEQLFALVSEAIPGAIIAPLEVEVVERLQILFFGNRHQGLTDFVLSDMGLAQYYPYELNLENRLFPCREALDEYLYSCELQDIFYQFLELDDTMGIEDVARLSLEMENSFAQNRGRWDRLYNTVGRELERRGQLALAEQLYTRSSSHPARERRVRILAAREDWEAVVSSCEEILLEPWNEAEREAGKALLARAGRKLGGGAVPRLTDKFQELKLTLKQGCECVERDALTFFEKQWQSVHYVENGLMNTLFGLAFWQQIFADVPGAFDNPFQGVPRDMYNGDFARCRSQAIAQRLSELKNGDLRGELTSAYQLYSGYQCHWTDWRLVDESLLHTALGCIPPEHLFAIWERQLFDPAENRSGFPDLIALGDGGAGDYCLIEVKGPGDALQNNQKRWLRYFSEHAIPASVAWVEWVGG